MFKFFLLVTLFSLGGSPDIVDSNHPSCEEFLYLLSQNVSRCIRDNDWDKISNEALNNLNKPSTGAVDLPITDENRFCQESIHYNISKLINTCKENDSWNSINDCAEKLL